MISLAENCDEYAEARAALADGALQISMCGAWVDVVHFGVSRPDGFLKQYKPSDFRRRPKPDEASTEPSVLQEHANLIAKLENEVDDGWWGDFGYTPASDRNGIANEAMRQAGCMTKERQGFSAFAGIVAGLAFVVLLVFGGEIASFVDAVIGKAQALQRVGR